MTSEPWMADRRSFLRGATSTAGLVLAGCATAEHGFEQVVAQVSRLEAIFGIADLAEFTAP